MPAQCQPLADAGSPRRNPPAPPRSSTRSAPATTSLTCALRTSP